MPYNFMALRKNNKTRIDFVWLDREMLLAENSIRLFSRKDAAGSDKNNPSEEKISGGSKKAHAFNCFSARNTNFTQTSNAQSANVHDENEYWRTEFKTAGRR